MLRYLLTIVWISILVIAPSFASCHVSDCDDADFIELGQKYPAVGFFSSPEGIIGSGTLVEVNTPKGSGRVIVTCAHIFMGGKKENITFNIGKNNPIQGTFYVHPEFLEFYRMYGSTFNTSFDIGIFILNEAVNDVSPASIGFDVPYVSFLDSNLLSVGFGTTGHVLGKYEIVDLNKRASYARAHSKYNLLEDTKKNFSLPDENNEITKVPVVRKKNSVITVCPYISSTLVDENNTLETVQNPAGVARSGDSGGGCFEIETNQLIGVISGGAGPKNPVECMYEIEYLSKYQIGIEKIVEEAQAEYQKQLDDIKQNSPDRVEEFLKTEIKPTMPPTVASQDLMNLINTRYEIENYYKTQQDNSQIFQDSSQNIELYLAQQDYAQTVDLDIVAISYHKDWILEVLKTCNLLD